VNLPIRCGDSLLTFTGLKFCLLLATPAKIVKRPNLCTESRKNQEKQSGIANAPIGKSLLAKMLTFP
jgi:hypothetical protein